MTAPKVQVTRAFVDVIDEGVARLLFDEKSGTVPADVLPADAQEGSWVELRIVTIPPPSDVDAVEQTRSDLSKHDDGGDLKLRPKSWLSSESRDSASEAPR